MPSHNETRLLPWRADQMFVLVADVQHYADFLPWVQAVRIRSDSETEMMADVIVGFKSVRETFSSRVTKTRPHHIHVDYLDGPLKHLHNDWKFADTPDGCAVDFHVDFAFRNRLFESLAGQYFERALRKMTDAFVARAELLYGAAPGISSSSATSAA